MRTLALWRSSYDHARHAFCLEPAKLMCRVLPPVLLLLLLPVLSLPVSAAPTRQQLTVSRCIELVSSQFEIEPLPIHLLFEVEGGWEGAVRQNANGSEDLGPMQVNSIHLPEFAALGITREEIRDNTGCRNVFVAVSLYLRHLQASDGNVAMAIARYHSKSSVHARVYLDRIAQIIARRLQRERALASR